jgi:hypothetical protein
MVQVSDSRQRFEGRKAVVGSECFELVAMVIRSPEKSATATVYDGAWWRSGMSRDSDTGPEVLRGSDLIPRPTHRQKLQHAVAFAWVPCQHLVITQHRHSPTSALR